MADVLVVLGVGGMGEAIARRIGTGKHVLLADFNEALLAEVESKLSGDGYLVTTHRVDVSDRASVAGVADAAQQIGAVRSVVHTAGVSPVQAPLQAVLNVDLLGTVYVLEEFARVIAPGGAGVVIASMAGSFAQGSFPAELEQALASVPAEQLLELPIFTSGALPDSGAAYSIAKRGNQLRVAASSRLWGERGARINSISPGIISTPMGQQELASESGASMREMVAGSAAKRLGTPNDIANAVAFLVGDEATFITGTDLLVDGGVVAAVRNGQVVLPARD